MQIPDDLIPLLAEMLMELSTEKLEVCLVPGDQPAKVRNGCLTRAVISQNPEWYQELCRLNPCNRSTKRKTTKPDTRVKRAYLLIVLERMIKNKQSASQYASFLLDVARDRKELMDELEAESLQPWNNQF